MEGLTVFNAPFPFNDANIMQLLQASPNSTATKKKKKTKAVRQ